MPSERIQCSRGGDATQEQNTKLHLRSGGEGLYSAILGLLPEVFGDLGVNLLLPPHSLPSHNARNASIDRACRAAQACKS